MNSVAAFVLGWALGSAVMYVYFVAVGLMRDREEWERWRKKHG